MPNRIAIIFVLFIIFCGLKELFRAEAASYPDSTGNNFGRVDAGNKARSTGLSNSNDSLIRERLKNELGQYLQNIAGKDNLLQKKEIDFLIQSVKDPAIQQFIATTLYEHYLNSKIMGDDAMAVYIVDKWFASGKIRMKNEIEHFSATMFAEFNRQSLIGQRAPSLFLENRKGNAYEILSNDRHSKVSLKSDRYRLIYFYDVDCAKCNLESIMLRNIIESHDFEFDVIAIYVGYERDRWLQYVKQNFNVKSKKNKIYHFWNSSQGDLDFQRKYAVLKTPMLFLLNEDGYIVGRRLNSHALYALLLEIKASKKDEEEYGSERSRLFYDNLFTSFGDTLKEKDILFVPKYLYIKSLQNGDISTFKRMTGDLLYYLVSRREEIYKNATLQLLDNYIFAFPQLWHTKNDSLKIIGLAEITKKVLNKSPIGMPLPELSVKGTLFSSKHPKGVSWNLSLEQFCAKGENGKAYIFFYSPSCQLCKKELSSVEAMMNSTTKDRIFAVDIERTLAEDEDRAKELFDLFDLSTLPFIVEVDDNACIAKKYCSFL